MQNEDIQYDFYAKKTMKRILVTPPFLTIYLTPPRS